VIDVIFAIKAAVVWLGVGLSGPTLLLGGVRPSVGRWAGEGPAALLSKLLAFESKTGVWVSEVTLEVSGEPTTGRWLGEREAMADMMSPGYVY
jgi:hypothetical protein